ncbi:hypothetical protein BaRGS_00019846 [Batillaria attramentaria]|uniref:Uncharacterized protein n=1 Tax=Batillaria attramentaria TaxID=370345 RepID=A0ABD0KPB7_9CAEN
MVQTGRVYAIFFLMAFVFYADVESGLESHPFYDIPSLIEVTCSGKRLSTATDIMSISLFTKRNNLVVCFINIAKRQCSTDSQDFVSCIVDNTNTRRTEARTLVTDLKFGMFREYGCNITAVDTLEKTVKIVSWSLVVKGESKCIIV